MKEAKDAGLRPGDVGEDRDADAGRSVGDDGAEVLRLCFARDEAHGCACPPALPPRFGVDQVSDGHAPDPRSRSLR